MKWGTAIHLAISGTLLGTVTYLFVQSTSTDPQDHVRVLETFNALNQSETDLRRNLLLVRGDLLLHYDTVNQAVADLHEHLEDLRSIAMKGPDKATGELGERFAVIQVTLAEDEEMVEQFKWNNALLRNSWSYFAEKNSNLSRLAAQRPSAEDTIPATVNHLLPAMLLVQHEPHGQAIDRAATDLDRLEKLPAPQWLKTHVDSLVKHGRLILRLAPEIDATLTGLLTSQTSEHVNALRKAYLADHQQSVYRAESHRILLYVFSLLLLAYLAYQFIRLQAGARALVRSNEMKMHEIAERKQAEDRARELQTELAHAHRLSLMGEMASSMAHELNQPLTAIRLYARGCARRLKSGGGSREELLDALNQLSGQVLRAGEILGWIRGFARKQQPCISRVDVNALVREAVNLLDYERKGMQISTDLQLSDSLPPVEADKTQVQQVFLNLIRNSIESMTEDRSLPARMIIRTSRAPDGMVEVEVEDSGLGMTPEVLEQAFDSFFTTKPHGMGLGLAICRSMIEAHGGRLWAVSEEGVGSHFYFTLQVAGEDSDDGITHEFERPTPDGAGSEPEQTIAAQNRSVA